MQQVTQPGQIKVFHPFRPDPGEQSLEGMRLQAIAAAKEIAVELKRQYSATRVVLFGSLARREFLPWSDIDIAVWGIPEKQFYRSVAFACGFSKIFKVELVDGADCTGDLYHSIVEEGIDL